MEEAEKTTTPKETQRSFIFVLIVLFKLNIVKTSIVMLKKKKNKKGRLRALVALLNTRMYLLFGRILARLLLLCLPKRQPYAESYCYEFEPFCEVIEPKLS